MEGSVVGDPANVLRIYEYGISTQTDANNLVGYYKLENPNNAIGDFTPVNANECLVIERDNNQSIVAKQKKIYKVDVSKVDENGFVAKEEVAAWCFSWSLLSIWTIELVHQDTTVNRCRSVKH